MTSPLPTDHPPSSRGPAPRGRGGGGAEEKGGLSRPVAEFLVAWAMAHHRFAMYPPGHPSLPPVSERMLLQLGTVLGTRPALAVGVTLTQLVVEGMPSAESHPVLADLAARLHAQQLGAVVFRRGIELDELTEALQVLARDPVRGERPLGALPTRDRPSWPHLTLLPMEYDALELAGGPAAASSSSVRELWLALFRSTIRGLRGADQGGAGGDPGEVGLVGTAGASEPDPESRGDRPVPGHGADRPSPGAGAVSPLPTGNEMAEAVVNWTEAGPGRERQVLEGIAQLVEALQWQGELEGAEVRARLVELFLAFPPDFLGQVIRVGSDGETRRLLLHRLARAGLEGDAVVPVLRAVVEAEGRALSAPMESILRKLGGRGRAGVADAGRTEARSALRDQIAAMLGEEDPHDLPAFADGVAEGEEEQLTSPTPFRVVELALRVDEPGPALVAALEACVRTGDIGSILDLAEGAPAESRTAMVVEAVLFDPQRLQLLLSGADVDEASMRRVVDALGDEAIGPLFEALASSESRAVRRKVFDRLVALGPRISGHILQYLSSDAWYVQRNMLALLQRLPALPPGFSPLKNLLSDDVRVRREALPLAFRDAGSRERALGIALADSDERVVRSALIELQSGVPDPLVEVLVEGVVEAEDRGHLRPLAARALGRSTRPAARDALLAMASEARGILARRRRLADPTPEVVAAVHALASGWRDDPEVRWVLEAARKSPHSRFQAAAGPDVQEEP